MWYIVRLDSSRVATLVKVRSGTRVSSSDPTSVKSNYISHILQFYGKSNAAHTWRPNWGCLTCKRGLRESVSCCIAAKESRMHIFKQVMSLLELLKSTPYGRELPTWNVFLLLLPRTSSPNMSLNFSPNHTKLCNIYVSTDHGIICGIFLSVLTHLSHKHWLLYIWVLLVGKTKFPPKEPDLVINVFTGEEHALVRDDSYSYRDVPQILSLWAPDYFVVSPIFFRYPLYSFPDATACHQKDL